MTAQGKDSNAGYGEIQRQIMLYRAQDGTEGNNLTLDFMITDASCPFLTIASPRQDALPRVGTLSHREYGISMNTRFEDALNQFDAYNQADPNAFIWNEKSYPREAFLAQQLHSWVLKLCPDANEALILASRCQHIGRWEMARDSFPEGRTGYLKWRRELMHHHAHKAGEILRAVGYDPETIARVQTIVQKIGVKKDSDVQTMENALCLVFLQYQYEAFHSKNAAKIVDILAQSLMKMDAAGHGFALALDYTPTGRHYVDLAVAQLDQRKTPAA